MPLWEGEFTRWWPDDGLIGATQRMSWERLTRHATGDGMDSGVRSQVMRVPAASWIEAEYPGRQPPRQDQARSTRRQPPCHLTIVLIT